MFQGNYFHNNWLDLTNLFTETTSNLYDEVEVDVNLSENFFETLRFDHNSIKKYRVQAAIEAVKTLGKHPAICISGGVDSQAMLQCFVESGCAFDAYTMVFKNDLNIHDVEYARKIANNYNIELREIEVDIKRFLIRENYNYGIRYKCPSPHFNTQFKLFDFLKNYGHSGICVSGDGISHIDDDWGQNIHYNSHCFINYSEINKIPIIGNFLSFYPQLCWAISLQTRQLVLPDLFAPKQDNLNLKEQKMRYYDKINGYIRSGFKIIPQDNKYTGYELVKKEFEKISGNPEEFEFRFRIPLQEKLNYRTVMAKLKFTDIHKKQVYKLLANNYSESVIVSNYGKIYRSYNHSDGFYFDYARAW